MFHIQELFPNIYFVICLSTIVAWELSHRMFPVIIYVVHKKRLLDKPEELKYHLTEVPNLGGVYVRGNLIYINPCAFHS